MQQLNVCGCREYLENVASDSLEQVADIFTKVFCEKTSSNLKSLLGIADHVVKHD